MGSIRNPIVWRLSPYLCTERQKMSGYTVKVWKLKVKELKEVIECFDDYETGDMDNYAEVICNHLHEEHLNVSAEGMY